MEIPAIDGPAPCKKAKRNRVTLSCTECKRRKVKCSAVHSISVGAPAFPCLACLKRNETASCQPLPHPSPSYTEDSPGATSDPAHTSAAFNSESLHARLFAIETTIKTDPKLAAELAKATSAMFNRPTSADSDAEDVVLVLEDLAMGSRREINPSLTQLNRDHRLYPSIATETSPSPLQVATINQIVAGLPDATIMHNLFALFFEDVSWPTRCTCKPQFFAELQEFFQLRQQHRCPEIDPAWIALVCMQLAMTFLILPKQQIQRSALTEDPYSMAFTYFEAAKLGVTLARCTEVAQLRVIQTITYLLPFITLHGCGIQANPFKFFGKTFDIWFSLAVQMAKELRLHQLGSDPNTMPAADKSIPQVPSGLARQMGSRIWWHLLFTDWWRSQGDPQLCAIDHEDTNTAEPLLLDDSQLTFDLHPKPFSPSELCDASFESLKWRAVVAVRKFCESKRLNNGVLDYSTVLYMETGFRSALEAVEALDKANQHHPRFPRERIAILTSSINAQILRAHRPYAIKGYKDPHYKHSSRTCVEVSLAIIFAQSTLPPELYSRYYMLFLHAFGASIGIITGLLCNLNLSENNPEVIRYRAAAQQALHILDCARGVKLEYLHNCVHLAHRTVTELLQVERTQRSMYLSGGLETERSVAGTFKDVASHLQAEIQSASGSLPRDAPHPVPGVSKERATPSGEELGFDIALLQEMGLLQPSIDTYMYDMYIPETGTGWPPESMGLYTGAI